MSIKAMTRADHFLVHARGIVKQRGKRRGQARDSHQAIATLWTAYLAIRKPGALLPWEVAVMMQLLKIARMHSGEHDPDHDFDNIGFAALAGELRRLGK